MTEVGQMARDALKCQDCEWLLDADEDEYQVTRYRCAVHLAELAAKVEERCRHDSVWTLERHKRGMIHDAQMVEVLDRLIARKRRAMRVAQWERGEAPDDAYAPSDCGVAHPG